ncbi:MAG: hypothetical protein V3V08_18720 [Nannocystaceae bacterium]
MTPSTISRPASVSALFFCLVVAGFSWGARGAHAGEGAAKPCITKKFTSKEVEKACKDGGRKAAKKMMKGLVKKAKAAGKKGMKCKGCHKNLKDFALTDEAVDGLKKLLALK